MSKLSRRLLLEVAGRRYLVGSVRVSIEVPTQYKAVSALALLTAFGAVCANKLVAQLSSKLCLVPS